MKILNSSLFCLELILGFMILVNTVFAQEQDEESVIMEEIEVETTLLDAPVIIDPTQSSTTFNREEIQSRQPDNIFEIIEDIPGVSASGGPRGNGIDLNIRGFESNEDVIYTLDGAVKNYEKYRFGGTFIEPGLLKSVEVTRGAATTETGSGALGGVVQMETKDASDFLKPGQKYGAATKYGHRFNNDEDVRSVTLFGAPFEKLDLLLNYTNRSSNDYKLTGTVSSEDGNTLPFSENNPESILGKVEYYLNEDTTLAFSYINFRQDGLEPLDTTTATPDGFGVVDRDTKDDTYTARLLFNPFNDLIDLSMNVGYVKTDVDEITQPDSFLPSGTRTNFKYDIWSFNVKNISYFEINDIGNTLTFGIDGEYSDRETARSLPAIGDVDFGSQPSGIYQQYGVYFLNQFDFGNLKITPGVRWDYNHARVKLNSTVDSLNSNNQDTSDSYDMLLPSISTSYQFGDSPFTIFANYWEQYRPPKIDEYYVVGAFGRCPASALLGVGVEPQDTTGVCGDLYDPEESDNYDLGLLVQQSNLWGADNLLAKLTYFDSEVDNVLETLNSDPDNPLIQTGTETRDGIELELNYSRQRASMNLSYSVINGETEGYWVGNDTVPSFANNPAATKQKRPIYSIPGDTLVLSTRFSFPEYHADIGWRGRHVGERKVLDTEVSVFNPPEVTLDGYMTHDIWANWRPFQNTGFSDSVVRFGIDNLTNKRYRVNLVDGIGNYSVSRNVKFTFDLNF